MENISDISTISTLVNLGVNSSCFGGDTWLVVKILSPLQVKYLHQNSQNMSVIFRNVEMVEIVEILSDYLKLRNGTLFFIHDFELSLCGTVICCLSNMAWDIYVISISQVSNSLERIRSDNYYFAAR